MGWTDYQTLLVWALGEYEEVLMDLGNLVSELVVLLVVYHVLVLVYLCVGKRLCGRTIT